MKMKFVKPAVVLVDGVPQTMFNEGDIQDLNPASAERWRRRGVAIDVVDQPTVIKPEKAAEPPAAASDETPPPAPSAPESGASGSKATRRK